MAPLDWDSVLSVDSTLLKDDEEAAEKAFQILAGVTYIQELHAVPVESLTCKGD